MKLESKHLAPYLPYGLKVVSKQGTLFQLNTYSDMRGKGIESRDIYSCLDNQYKPILRPLSDLTKEIEVDSELTTISEDKTWGRFDEIATLKTHQLRFIQLREYELLLEYHFDVFGLIEQGLAIDINTLNK